MERELTTITDADISALARQLTQGAVGVIPTDTIYGFICLPRRQTIDRLVTVKQRPPERPFLLTAADTAAAESLMTVPPDRLHRLADLFWPGPLTVIAPAASGLDLPIPEVISPAGEIAVRVPRFSFLRKLLHQCGGTAVSTSVNRCAAPAMTHARDIYHEFAEEIDFLISDERKAGLPSTIIRLAPDGLAIIREGAIPSSDIPADL